MSTHWRGVSSPAWLVRVAGEETRPTLLLREKEDTVRVKVVPVLPVEQDITILRRMVETYNKGLLPNSVQSAFGTDRGGLGLVQWKGCEYLVVRVILFLSQSYM